MPHKHVEMLSDGTNVPLGQWCRNIRNENNTKRGNYLLTEEMEKQLTRLGFVWDTIKYKFEKKVSEVATYYKKYGNFPSQHSENFEIRNLGIFLVNIRQDIKKDIFPEWKEMLIKKYIPEFSCENNNVAAFKRFFYYAKRYKEENGHLNIKKNDVIGDDYKIGIIFGGMRQKYKKGLFKSSEVKQLEELGLCLGGKFNKQYNEKMELAMQAANDGTIINFKNQIYNGVNLYTWIKCTIKKKFQNGELLKNERDCIERLLDVSLDNFFENIKRDRIYRPIKIVDKKENKDIAVCKTYKKVSDIMQRRFNVKVSSSVINQ